MYTVTASNAIRVNKRNAKKLYNRNCEIVLVGHKMWPFDGTNLGYHIQKSDIDSREDGWTFDKLVNNHAYYNTSFEEGYYAAYYANRVDVAAHKLTAHKERD